VDCLVVLFVIEVRGWGRVWGGAGFYLLCCGVCVWGLCGI